MYQNYALKVSVDQVCHTRHWISDVLRVSSVDTIVTLAVRNRTHDGKTKKKKKEKESSRPFSIAMVSNYGLKVCKKSRSGD